jgi:hypothetical protein
LALEIEVVKELRLQNRVGVGRTQQTTTLKVNFEDLEKKPTFD